MSDFDFKNEQLGQGWANDQFKSEHRGFGVIGLEQHEKKNLTEIFQRSEEGQVAQFCL